MGAKLMLFCGLMSLAFICATGGVIDNNETSDSDYFGVHVYPIERECALQGGICVHKEDCEESHLTSKRGLCPSYKDFGVECCYQVISRPATCKQYLGECMPSCHASLIREEATDCPENTKCCTLVL